MVVERSKVQWTVVGRRATGTLRVDTGAPGLRQMGKDASSSASTMK